MPIKPKRLVEDQLGQKVEIPTNPQRIISLVPSQTELLFDLGLEDRVVGITKFCIHPEEWFKTKARIGGTKQVNFEKIKVLNPDLIIANKEENTKEDIERLAQDYPVWVSDVNNLDSAVEMIVQIGKITQTDTSHLIEEITSGFTSLEPLMSPQRVLYLIWKKPYMAAGSGTFIDDMLMQLGLENAVNNQRYPELTETEIVGLNPDHVFLSSEPFPFGHTHIQDLEDILPNATIKLVDGEMFSWYGSRLKLAPSYFANLLESIKE